MTVVSPHAHPIILLVKYASVYPRKGSPKFSISYWDTKEQKRVSITTPFRVDDPQGRRKALDLAREKSKDAAADRATLGRERWENWAEAFLRERYGGSPKTLKRMLGAWSQWQCYLRTQGIPVPRGLDYNRVLGFIAYRSAQVKPSSGKRVSKNTALCDVRAMSVLMREAMRRGYAETNHCEKLGIGKDPAKQKPEMTDPEIAAIRQGLAGRPDWMRISFEIALHQGCRLTETALPLSAVDLTRNTLTFCAKGRGGGLKHEFTTSLHPGLRPMMEALVAAGASVTCELPVMAAKEWHSFFREIRLPHLCFHCTRVTVITRMARAGVPIAQAMAFVGHASQTIHRVYQRLATTDLARAVAAVSYAGGSTPRNPYASPASGAAAAPS